MAEPESCPLAKKGDCSKSPDKDSEHYFGQETRAANCCAFPAKVFDKVRKIEKQPELATAAIVEIAALKFSRTEKNFPSPKLFQSFVRNRGSTHLTNCVFRI